MAEAFGSGTSRENLSPLEEQYIKEQEEEEDADQELAIEKDIAAQRLWQSFQESATAVAHLFRDCQQRAGLSAWVPFHESASAVTQLYRGSAEVCRQCIDCGVRYGHRKRTKDVLAWAKKKKKFIKREELIAFLLDKPEQSSLCELTTSRMEDTNDLAASPMTGCGYSIPSPRRRLLCREDLPISDTEMFSSRDLSRKRQNSLNFDINGGGGVASCGDFGPVMKRIKF